MLPTAFKMEMIWKLLSLICAWAYEEQQERQVEKFHSIKKLAANLEKENDLSIYYI